VLDIDRVRIPLLKRRSAQTVKHVLVLLKRIIDYGARKGYTPPLSFKVELPEVDNIKTEDLSPEQLKRFMQTLEIYPHQRAVSIMKIALFSGM